MKTRSVSVSLLAVALLCGCSTYESRLQERASAIASATPAQRAAMDAGRVEVGFTPDMVYVVLGQPERVERDARTGEETWLYTTGDAGSAWRGGMATMDRQAMRFRVRFTRGRVSAILIG